MPVAAQSLSLRMCACPSTGRRAIIPGAISAGSPLSHPRPWIAGHVTGSSSAGADALFAKLQQTLAPSYRIERELGGGGMSRVFVARDLALDRPVVIKVLPESVVEGLSAERFHREIMLSAALQHPNIIGVIAAGEAQGLPYFVMPLVEGESLRSRLARDGAMSIPGTVAVLRDVARALGYAHARGIVHRDIKPDNILMTGGAAVVADFGVAKALVLASATPDEASQTLTRVGMSLGTPAYMAPEQVVADPAADQRVDVYSLGVMAFEMLTGRQPFTGASVSEVMSAHLSKAPEPLATARPGVSLALGQLVARCLEKDPAMRPQTAQEILQILDDPAVVSGAVPSLPALQSPEAPGRNGPRWRVITGVAVGLLVIAAGVWVLRGSMRSPAASAAAAPAIAVLPLELASPDTADAYLAQGIADELLSALARIPGVKVASRLAAKSLATASDPAALARSLGVTMTLEGTVQRRGDRLRVTARLVNASDGFAAWTETYDRPASDLFALQGEIAAGVASVVRADLAREDAASRLGRVRTETPDPQAYDDFLRGHYLLVQRGAASLRGAAEYFERAIARDSAFARAWAELAQTYAVLPLYTGGSSELRANAERAARRALAIDSLLAPAHAALGYMQNAAWQWAEGRASLERAVALDSTDAAAVQWLGENLLMSGDHAGAVRALAQAERLDRESTVIAALHAVARAVNGDIEGAIQAGRRAVDADPSQAVPRFMLGTIFAYGGRYDESIGELREARRLAPGILPVLGALGYSLARAGRVGEAQAILAELRRGAGRPGALPAIAKILTAVGDDPGAVRSLLQAAGAHDGFFASEPLGSSMFANVRRDPGFAEVLEKVGLPATTFTR
jgi:serine/threonine-protein kinase